MRILLPLLMLSTLSFGQNKKEQIALLSSRVDSLKTLLDKERDYSSSQILNLNSTIERLMVDSTRSDDKIKFQGNQIISFEKVIDSLNFILKKTSKQLNSLEEEFSAWRDDNVRVEFVANGTLLHRYENGQLGWEENFKDEEYDGVQRRWHENGQLWFEMNYKDGKIIDDKVVYYNEDGTIKRTEYWEDGIWVRCEGDCDFDIEE